VSFLISIDEFYRFRGCIHEHGTRRCNDYFVEIEYGVISDFTLKYLGPSVWNSLPVSFRVAGHPQQFKNRLKEYFLSFFGKGYVRGL
jgi:hypothetical protein